MNNNLQDNQVQGDKTPSKTADPSLCQGCYEFFGNPASENLCSKCFQAKQNPKPATSEYSALTEKIMATIKMNEEEVKPEEKPAEESKETEPPKQIDTSKCHKCKKKVGLLGHECKCGATYCKLHRLPENHDCDFDFCTKERERIKKQNPLVTAAKLVKF